MIIKTLNILSVYIIADTYYNIGTGLFKIIYLVSSGFNILVNVRIFF